MFVTSDVQNKGSALFPLLKLVKVSEVFDPDSPGIYTFLPLCVSD